MSSAVHGDRVAADRPVATSTSGGERDELAALVDASLVASLVTGQDRALTALHARHGSAVYSIAAVLCGPERALEIATEVFVSLWHRPDAFQPERSSLRAYLTCHAHRLAATALRADTYDGAVGSHECADAEAEALVERAGGGVRDTLRGLPAAPRTAIVLAYFGGHTVHEVGRWLGGSQQATGQHLRTGLTQLRNAPP